MGRVNGYVLRKMNGRTLCLASILPDVPAYLGSLLKRVAGIALVALKAPYYNCRQFIEAVAAEIVGAVEDTLSFVLSEVGNVGGAIYPTIADKIAEIEFPFGKPQL